MEPKPIPPARRKGGEKAPRRIPWVKMTRALAAQKAKRLARQPVAVPGQAPGLWSELAEEGNRRLRSGGGRPTSAEWTVRRLIPLKKEDWDHLVRLGRRLGLSGGQLAALLVEHGLKRLASERF